MASPWAYEIVAKLGGAPGPAAPKEEDPSVLGFLGNVVGDVKDLALGTAQFLVGTGKDIITNPVSTLQDVGDLALEAVTLGNADVGDYRTTTGSLLSQMPQAIASDYASRYGSDIGEQLYENPLSYLLDALMVGGAAAKGAEVAAKGAVKASELAGGAAQVATEALGPKAGLRVGLEALSTERPLGAGLRMAERILPGTQPSFTGQGFDLVSDIRNPVTRAMMSPVRRLTTEPLGSARLPEDILATAAEAGLSRIPRAPIRNVQTKVLAAKILGESWTRFLNRREGDLLKIRQTIQPYVERNPALAEQAHGIIQRLDVDVDGLEAVDTLTPDEALRQNIEGNLRFMVERDPDLASVRNSLGLNRFDSPKAHRLAEKLDNGEGLTPEELGEAESMLGKYRRQLGEAPVQRYIAQTYAGPRKRTPLAGTSQGLLEGTKVVDQAGQPIRVYHGTTSTFKNFDRMQSEEGLYGPGLYFAEDPAVSSRYAGSELGSPNYQQERIFNTEVEAREFAASLGREDVHVNPIASPSDLVDGTQPWVVGWDLASGGNQVRMQYLNIKNPFDATRTYTQNEARAILESADILDPETVDYILGGEFAFTTEAEARAAAKAGETVFPVADGWAIGQPLKGSELFTGVQNAIGGEGGVEVLRAAGYDGVFHVGRQDGRVWVAFDSNQVVPFPEAPATPVIHQPDLTPDERAAFNGLGEDATVALARVDEAAKVAREHVDGLSQRLNQTTDPAEQAALSRRIDLSNRYLRSIYDPLRRRVIAEAGGGVDEAESLLNDVRLMAHETMTAPEIRAGFLTPDEALERAYLPMRIRYGAKWNAKEGRWDGGPSVEDLDDALTAAGLGAPVYFPHLNLSKLRFSDFLLARSRVGALKAAQAGWRKQNKGVLFEKGEYVKDPIEAMSRRASQAIKHEETIRLFDTLLGKMGREIDSLDELTPGETFIAPEDLWRRYRHKVTLDDAFDAISDGIDDERLAGMLQDVHGQILEEFPEAANKIVLSNLGVTKRGVKLYAVPKAVGKQMDDLVRSWGGEGVRLFWDGPMNVWRSLVLTFSPRWLVNNFLGNTLFAKVQGARVRDALKIMEERFLQTINQRWGTNIKTPTLDALKELPFSERIGSGFSSLESQYVSKLGAAGDTKAGRIYEGARRTKVGKAATGWSGFMRRVNSEIESAFREASFMRSLEKEQSIGRVTNIAREFWSTKKRLEKIAQDGVTEGMARRALQDVDRFFGNYAAMTPFERNVIRRFIFPFWGFVRHQGKLLASMPFVVPERAAVLNQIAQLTQEYFDEYGPVPEWLEGALPTDPYGPGDIRFLSTRGADPFQATFQPPLLSLSPIAKVVLEQSLGESLLTGDEFSDPSVIPGAFGGDERFRIIRDDEGNIVDVAPAGNVTPGILEHLLRQIPQYSSIERLVGGGKLYDTANLLTIIKGALEGTGEGVLLDEATGEPKYPVTIGQELAKLSGVNVTPYDLQEYQRELAEEALAGLTNAYRSDVGF